jgi:glycosyltransferase involved in cell wall biosynthesis
MRFASPRDFRPGEGVRVLLCIPTLCGGGAERQIRLLAPRLVERGMHVALFSRFGPGDAESLTAAGIECFPIAAVGNHDPRIVVQLARAARRSNAQIVHTWLTQMDVIGGAVALATRKIWVLSERTSPEGYRGTIKERTRFALGRFADLVVANSPSGLAAWPHHPRLTVIGNGIDFEALDAAPTAFADRTAEGRPLILVAARLARCKRIDAVLRAVPHLRRAFPDALLAIIGAGPEETSLKALAAEFGIERSVYFAGFRQDVWSWIKSASVFISASRVEGQPNLVLEAAAAGIPQVLSDIRMHRDTVGDEGALFVDPGDPAALSDAIESLIRGPSLARRLAASARSAVLGLSIGRAAENYAELYRRAAGAASLEGERQGVALPATR